MREKLNTLKQSGGVSTLRAWESIKARSVIQTRVLMNGGDWRRARNAILQADHFLKTKLQKSLKKECGDNVTGDLGALLHKTYLKLCDSEDQDMQPHDCKAVLIPKIGLKPEERVVVRVLLNRFWYPVEEVDE